MNIFKKVIIAVIIAVGLVAVPATIDAYAACSTPAACIQDGVKGTGSGGSTDINKLLGTVVNIILFVLGAAAVIMIVIGGFRYVVSQGDSSAIKGAKDTILYSVIGLIVAILAYAIVNFVLTQFVKP